MSGSDVIVVGSCMIDLICYADKLPKPGETIHGTDFMIGHGGKGANQCVAAAKLGANVSLIAKLGDDSFGRDYLKSLVEIGVETKYVNLASNISSGMAQITVSKTGENQIVIVPGANSKLDISDIVCAEKDVINAKVFLFQFETPLATTLLSLKYIKEKNKDAITVVNAAPAIKSFSSEIFQLSDIFCVNETEAEELCDLPVKSIDNAKEALKKLIELGCNTVIITLGKNGAVFNCDKEGCTIEHITTEQVTPVDTTGAGDAFLGALGFFLSRYRDLPLSTQIRRSCCVASNSVTKTGTQSSYPTAAQLPASLFSKEY